MSSSLPSASSAGPAEYVGLKTQVNALVSALGQFLGDQAGREGQAVDEQLQRFRTHFGSLRGQDETLVVAVLALTKSGKSTLLNALVSSDLLPCNNVPETARICKVVHAPADAADDAWLQEPGGVPPVRGEKAIRARLAQLNADVRGHRRVEACDEQLLHIHAPIAALQGFEGTGLSLALLDTPGPNEEGEDNLRFQVDRLLDSVDAAIYILDYTKLKTCEEADLFRRIKQINPQLVKRLSQRLFFVVNKADAAEVSDGMGPDATRAYVATLVTKQVACPGFLLHPDQVVLVSARGAMLGRLVMSGKADEDVSRRFTRLAFGMPGFARAEPNRQQMLAAAHAMVCESGVPDLEARVISFLYAHSAGVKLMATLDNARRLIAEVLNVALTQSASLRTDVAQLQVQTTELRVRLQGTLMQFDDCMAGTDALQSEVTDLIRTHLHSLRERLFDYIFRTLEEAGPDSAQRSGGSAAPPPAAASPFPASSRLPRVWQGVRDHFLAMFTPDDSAAGGGSAAKSRSREELQALVTNLHENLTAQIHQEVSSFWHELESLTNARHASLLRHLNEALVTLSRQVEAAVSASLDVHLEPVDMVIAMPSALEFHSDLQHLIAKGIVTTKEQRAAPRREGLCQHWASYWDVHTSSWRRGGAEMQVVTVYELSPGEITAHFVEQVDKAIEGTARSLKAYVRSFVRTQTHTARAKLQEYSERYMSTMVAALDDSMRSADVRGAALVRAERHVTHLQRLMAAAGDLQARTERLVPQARQEPGTAPTDQAVSEISTAPAAAASGRATGRGRVQHVRLTDAEADGLIQAAIAAEEAARTDAAAAAVTAAATAAAVAAPSMPFMADSHLVAALAAAGEVDAMDSDADWDDVPALVPMLAPAVYCGAPFGSSSSGSSSALPSLPLPLAVSAPPPLSPGLAAAWRMAAPPPSLNDLVREEMLLPACGSPGAAAADSPSRRWALFCQQQQAVQASLGGEEEEAEDVEDSDEEEEEETASEAFETSGESEDEEATAEEASEDEESESTSEDETCEAVTADEESSSSSSSSSPSSSSSSSSEEDEEEEDSSEDTSSSEEEEEEEDDDASSDGLAAEEDGGAAAAAAAADTSLAAGAGNVMTVDERAALREAMAALNLAVERSHHALDASWEGSLMADDEEVPAAEACHDALPSPPPLAHLLGTGRNWMTAVAAEGEAALAAYRRHVVAPVVAESEAALAAYRRHIVAPVLAEAGEAALAAYRRHVASPVLAALARRGDAGDGEAAPAVAAAAAAAAPVDPAALDASQGLVACASVAAEEAPGPAAGVNASVSSLLDMDVYLAGLGAAGGLGGDVLDAYEGTWVTSPPCELGEAADWLPEAHATFEHGMVCSAPRSDISGGVHGTCAAADGAPLSPVTGSQSWGGPVQAADAHDPWAAAAPPLWAVDADEDADESMLHGSPPCPVLTPAIDPAPETAAAAEEVVSEEEAADAVATDDGVAAPAADEAGSPAAIGVERAESSEEWDLVNAEQEEEEEEGGAGGL